MQASMPKARNESAASADPVDGHNYNLQIAKRWTSKNNLDRFHENCSLIIFGGLCTTAIDSSSVFWFVYSEIQNIQIKQQFVLVVQFLAHFLAHFVQRGVRSI